MSDMTRGEFLGIGAALATAAGAGCMARGPRDNARSEGSPDLALLNGCVLTSDKAQPLAEAFAIRHGRFEAVGSTNDVRNLISPDTELIDGSGTTVTPGFIDAHSHPLWGGLQALVSVDTNLGSIRRIREALTERAREMPPGEWVVGYMYDDTKLAEGRPLLRRDLDETVPGHPVYVGHRGGHTAVVNSQALELAGITIDTRDPTGGKYYREQGALTGRLAENGLNAFSPLLPDPSSRQQRQEAVKLISELMSASGLTSVHAAGISTVDFTAFQDAHAAGELGFRANLFPNAATYPAFKAAGVRSGFGDEWIRVGPVKYLTDGSASERTMRMSTPFIGRPYDYGILTMSQEEIHQVVDDAHNAGWQVAIHANGDVAIDMVLNAYERAQVSWPRANRMPAIVSSTAHWLLPTCLNGSRRPERFQLRSTLTLTTTATNGRSTAKRRWSGCSHTGRSSSTEFPWRLRRIGRRVPSNLSWRSKAW